MDRRLNCFVELLIQFEVDIEVHLLQILINLLVDKRKILLDNFCLDTAIFEKTVDEIMVGDIILTLYQVIVGLV